MNGNNGQIRFMDHYGNQILDVRSFVDVWLHRHPMGEIHVGTDSKVYGPNVMYATVICLWNVGNGVHEIYRRERTKRPQDKYLRLWNEVTKAVDTANMLDGLGKITVHVDLNPNPKFYSSKLYDASIGLITSLGYEAAGKPYSWAATSGANRHCN